MTRTSDLGASDGTWDIRVVATTDTHVEVVVTTPKGKEHRRKLRADDHLGFPGSELWITQRGPEHVTEEAAE